jgi:heme A synthase
MKEDKIQIKGISVNVRGGIWVSCLLVSVVFLGLMVSTNAVGKVTCTHPPSNLVSWWPGDGNAFDIENGNDGTFNGIPVYGTGKVWSAFSFDGNVANFVSVPADASLDLTQFTVDAWIYPTTSSGVQ